MKKLSLILFFLSFYMLGNAQIFEWANQLNGAGRSAIYQTIINNSGEIYLAGSFTGTIDFDSGEEEYLLTSFGDYDAFILKLNADANFIWAKQIGGTGTDYIRGLDLDENGNIYCIGAFSNVADMDPSDGNVYYTSHGGLDVYVAELDVNGEYVWSGHIGGTVDDNGVNVEISSSGNIYLSGYFLGTADFNPLETEAFNLTASGQAVFVEKLNPNHDLLWAKTMGGPGFDYCQDLCLDENENIYTTGMFAGAADFDPGDGTFYLNAVGDRDIFVSKLNSDGEYVWAVSMGGPEVESGQSIVYDDVSNIYICGNFKGTVDFGPNTETYYMTSNGDNDIFIEKLSTEAEFQWMKQIGGIGSDSPYAMSIDNQDNIYTTGLFMNTIDFNPGDEVFDLTSYGDYDAFISKLNSDGDFVWAANIGGAELDRGLSIINSEANEVFVGGLFTGTADFDPGNESYYLTASGEYNAFLLKLNTQLSGLDTHNFTNINIFPNPSSDFVTVNFGQNITDADILVFDIMGRIVKNFKANNQNSILLDFRETPGLYFVKITSQQGVDKTIKVIID